MRKSLYIRLEPKLKQKFRKIAKSERRDMNSLVLFLIDKKIAEVKNARRKIKS